jgi:hypothetical protein
MEVLTIDGRGLCRYGLCLVAMGEEMSVRFALVVLIRRCRCNLCRVEWIREMKRFTGVVFKMKVEDESDSNRGGSVLFSAAGIGYTNIQRAVQ